MIKKYFYLIFFSGFPCIRMDPDLFSGYQLQVRDRLSKLEKAVTELREEETGDDIGMAATFGVGLVAGGFAALFARWAWLRLCALCAKKEEEEKVDKKKKKKKISPTLPSIEAGDEEEEEEDSEEEKKKVQDKKVRILSGNSCLISRKF